MVTVILVCEWHMVLIRNKTVHLKQQEKNWGWSSREFCRGGKWLFKFPPVLPDQKVSQPLPSGLTLCFFSSCVSFRSLLSIWPLLSPLNPELWSPSFFPSSIVWFPTTYLPICSVSPAHSVWRQEVLKQFYLKNCPSCCWSDPYICPSPLNWGPGLRTGGLFDSLSCSSGAGMLLCSPRLF